MSLFSKCLSLDQNIRKPLDVGLIWEGNYWDDQDVHDCCDVDWETLEFLVRKIGAAFLEHHAPIDSEKNSKKPEKILIFFPKILQLPLTILATHHIGFVSIIMNPLTTSSEVLSDVVIQEKPKFLVTVDAVWQAQDLIEVKRKIENLPGMDETQLLVIRHVAPNPGVPPPRKDIPARRPSYKTSMELRNGRDLEWSTVMANIQVKGASKREKSIEKFGKDDVVVIVYDGGSPLSITNCQLLEALEARKMGLDAEIQEENVENMMVLEHPRDVGTLVDLLVPWFMGKTLTMYEGPLDYPDSSRLSQIISKHSVNYLLSSSASESVIPNPEYLQFFPVPSLKFAEIFSTLLSK